MSGHRQSKGHFFGGIIFLVLLGLGVYIADNYLKQYLFGSESLPVKAVEIDGAFTQLSKKDLAKLTGRLVAGQNIATLDLKQLESRLSLDPWVAQASVHRKMPDTLVIAVIEHVPAAYWNERGLYDAHSKTVFYPDLRRFDEPLVRLGAFRDDLASEVYTGAVEFIKLMRDSPYQLVELYLDQVHCYTITLANGTKLILGREGKEARRRLKRFLKTFKATGLKIDDVEYVDLRYDVGFAVGKKTDNQDEQGAVVDAFSQGQRPESANRTKKR